MKRCGHQGGRLGTILDYVCKRQFDYKYQNPLSLACPMLIRAIVISTPIEKQTELW